MTNLSNTSGLHDLGGEKAVKQLVDRCIAKGLLTRQRHLKPAEMESRKESNRYRAHKSKERDEIDEIFKRLQE